MWLKKDKYSVPAANDILNYVYICFGVQIKLFLEVIFLSCVGLKIQTIYLLYVNYGITQ